jgi:hypothetical protein
MRKTGEFALVNRSVSFWRCAIPREVVANTETCKVFFLTQRRKVAEFLLPLRLCVRPSNESLMELSATLCEEWRNRKTRERGTQLAQQVTISREPTRGPSLTLRVTKRFLAAQTSPRSQRESSTDWRNSLQVAACTQDNETSPFVSCPRVESAWFSWVGGVV